MSMDLNKAMLIGRLTRDVEFRQTTTGQPVASFGLATNRVFTQNEQKQERVEYHNIVAWGRLAEICQQYLAKGRRVYIEGRLQTRDWEGQDGVKRYKTEIITENMIMLDGRSGVGGSSPMSTSANEPNMKSEEPPSGATSSNDDVEIENIPF